MLNQSADSPLMTPTSSALEFGQELGQRLIGVYLFRVVCFAVCTPAFLKVNADRSRLTCTFVHRYMQVLCGSFFLFSVFFY